jgi:hypothetical protein
MSDITSPYDWLLIRATKDNSNTTRRLRRIWVARCALDIDHIEEAEMDRWIASRLLDIFSKLKTAYPSPELALWEVITDAAPKECWKVGASSTNDYWTRIMLALASKIRLTKVVDFPNYRAPARFRDCVNKQPYGT